MDYCTCDGTKATVCSYCDKFHKLSNGLEERHFKEHSENLDNCLRAMKWFPKDFKDAPDETSNLKLDINMNNEKLKRANELSNLIPQIKEEIELVENCSSLSSLKFKMGYSELRVDEKVVNFKSLKSQILSSMRKRLKDLESEFAKL